MEVNKDPFFRILFGITEVFGPDAVMVPGTVVVLWLPLGFVLYGIEMGEYSNHSLKSNG